ncbi:MAG: trypsin-like peptidase domain-containing protein [Alphaproteobacteria bacterium]|nr:trypsin-like peptidase domain-containing protein [Alphaproteobacteria bacterium]
MTLDRADQLITVEKLNEALVLLKSLETTTPAATARVNTLLGKIYLRLDKPAKAADLFEHAVLSTMEDAEAYLGLAEAQLALGKLTRARRHARTAILSDPDLIEAHLLLARVDDRSGHVAGSRQRFKKLKEDQPESERVTVAYARFLAYRDDVNTATAMLSQFLDHHPFAAEAGDLLGLLYWQEGRKADSLLARANAARAFRARGNNFRAKAVFSWIAENDPGGKYGEHVKIAALPRPETSPQLQDSGESEPVPAPVPPVEQAALPDAQPSVPETPRVLEYPDPLPLPAGVNVSSGSGFIVDGGRYVITNRHVIQNSGKIAVRSGTGEVRNARIVTLDQDNDLAVLELSESFPEHYAIPFAKMADANTGSPAVVMGFPMAGVFGWRQPSLTEGVVSKATGLSDDPGTFLITSKMNKGNSGGPVFDRRGCLIGVAVAKLDITGVYEKKGHLPEDVNIAIKASRLLKFLDQASNEDGPSCNPEIELEDLYQEMLVKVVLVAAELK